MISARDSMSFLKYFFRLFFFYVRAFLTWWQGDFREIGHKFLKISVPELYNYNYNIYKWL